MGWKLLARRRWGASGVVVSEMSDTETGTRRRYVATIKGWTNWRLLETNTLGNEQRVRIVRDRAEAIRDRINSGDESIFGKGRKDPLRHCEQCGEKYQNEEEPFPYKPLYRGGNKILICRDCLTKNIGIRERR